MARYVWIFVAALSISACTQSVKQVPAKCVERETAEAGDLNFAEATECNELWWGPVFLADYASEATQHEDKVRIHFNVFESVPPSMLLRNMDNDGVLEMNFPADHKRRTDYFSYFDPGRYQARADIWPIGSVACEPFVARPGYEYVFISALKESIFFVEGVQWRGDWGKHTGDSRGIVAHCR